MRGIEAANRYRNIRHEASVILRPTGGRTSQHGGQRLAALADRVMHRVAQRTISCPHCGLVLTIEDAQGSTRISYDPGEWQRLCRYLDLGSPALCLLEGGGDGPHPPGHGSGRPTH